MQGNRKKKGKPFEPVTVVSMISPMFHPFARHLLRHNLEEQPDWQEWYQNKMMLKHESGLCISRDVFPFKPGQKHSSCWCVQVQLFG